MRKLFFLLGLFFLFLPFTNFGQIYFTVELQDDSITYLVKIRPEKTYTSPLNITNSAQCSFVVPTGGFRSGNIKNINGVWKNENDVISPENNSNNDYLVFNLSGNITNLNYVKGEEVVLFSFQNIGKRVGQPNFVSKTDINLLKTQKINIGNYISVLGAGRINAFSGVYHSRISKNQPPKAVAETKKGETAIADTPIRRGQLSSSVFEFSTTVKNQMIHLEWLASQTDQTENFIIEKSVDGIHFEPIKKVSDVSDYHYKEMDESPDYGVNYYRIRQEFVSGEHRYSPIRQEKYYIDEASISIYPNPVKDIFRLRIGHFTKLAGQVHIFNMSGIEMAYQELDVANKEVKFNTSSFPGGLYILVIQSKNRKIIERQFVVENGK